MMPTFLARASEKTAYPLPTIDENWEFYFSLVTRKLPETRTRVVHGMVGGNLGNSMRREAGV